MLNAIIAISDISILGVHAGLSETTAGENLTPGQGCFKTFAEQLISVFQEYIFFDYIYKGNLTVCYCRRHFRIMMPISPLQVIGTDNGL